MKIKRNNSNQIVFLITLVVAVAVLICQSPAFAQAFNTGNWQGNTWSGNVNSGTWFPAVSGGVATFAADDTSWGQIRSATNFYGSVRTTFYVKPSLVSGGSYPDEAHFTYGNQWAGYYDNPVGQLVTNNPPQQAGIQFIGGTVLIGDKRVGFSPIGSYVPNQWVKVTMDYSMSGLLQVVGPGFSGTFQSTNMYTNGFKLIMALGDSSDGIQVSNVNSIVTSSNLNLTSSDWVGNRWDHNNDQGAWFPSVSSGVATFAIDDFQWGQLRSKTNYAGSIRATLEFNAALNSGGVNSDDAYFVFGNQWVYYGSQPTMGIMLRGGGVYLYDYSAGGELQQVGSYQTNSWTSLTLDLNSRGLLRVSGPGISGSYQVFTNLASYNFIVAEKDSSTGIRIRNVALSASGNITSAVSGATYFGLQINDGLVGQPYTIYSTTNLQSLVWTPAMTFTQAVGGFLWVDTNSPANKPAKFYRVQP